MTLIIRGIDRHGSGHYGASRGRRTHIGVDIVTHSGEEFRALESGVVTKLGYPYANDLSYRYVQVTADTGLRYRYFYVSPLVKMGEVIAAGDVLGVCQDLRVRYPGMTQHVHFEVMKGGDPIDPTPIVDAFNARACK